ncbi:MAG: MAF flag10 domain containing protein, partial [Nitrosopumilaceae archaeon]
FKAKKIVLFGMDFGTTIGMYSKNRVPNRKTKLKKLRKGKKLLEWLVSKNSLDLYTTSRSIKGFKKIHYADIKNIL